MKSIIEFLNESKGMNLFDRDAYREADHTDPLIKMKQSRKLRAAKLKIDKYKALIQNLINDTNVLNIDNLKNNVYWFGNALSNKFGDLVLKDFFIPTADNMKDGGPDFWNCNKNNLEVIGDSFTAFAENVSKGNKTVEKFMDNFLKRDKIMMKYYVEEADIAAETNNWDVENYIDEPRFMWWLKDGSFGIIFIAPFADLDTTDDAISFIKNVHSDVVYVFNKFEKLIDKINTEYKEYKGRY